MNEHASTDGPIDRLDGPKNIKQWTEKWWEQAKPEVQARRCIAHSTRTGKRCNKAAMVNQGVCGTHGGKARHSVEAARRRMMENADPAVKKLTEIAYDASKSDEIRLKATLAIIDRAGLSPRQAMEIEFGPPKPFEQVYDSLIHMDGGSRAAHRGEPHDDEPPALVASHHEAIDVEVVDDLDGDNPANLEGLAQPITPDGYERGSVFDVAPPAAAVAMPMDQANAELARLRARHRPDGHAMSHRGQRAHPPGKSARR